MVSSVGKSGISAFVGVVVVVLASTVGWIVVPNVIKSQVVIKEGTAVFDAWSQPPVPIAMQFFLFHVNNSEEVLKGEKPVLVQKGPFTFRETRKKENVTEKDGTLTYKETQGYFYNFTEGELSLDEKLTTVNPIYITLASAIADLPKETENKERISNLMNTFLAGIDEKPFMTHTVRELLFEGWSLKGYIEVLDKLNSTILSGKLPSLPEAITNDPKFGFFWGRNGSNTGEFNVESGANGIDTLGRINTWRGQTKLKAWPSEYCNMINGSDGTIYPPLIDKEKEIYIFNNDLCRSIYATYEKDVDVLGLKGYRFTVPERVFGNYSVNEDNKCYCRTADTEPEKCFDAGILDLRPCLLGVVPLLMSTPHFYQGAQKYIDGVVGLNPQKEEHETHFDLEPSTALPLFASKRIQINLDFQKYYVRRLSKVRNTVFPILWINETAKFDDASANQVYALFSLVEGINIGRWVLLAVGIAVTVGSTVALAVFYSKRNRTIV